VLVLDRAARSKQPDEVTLLAVTQIGPGQLWVTAKVSVHLTDP
jgi:hypothetical protein